MICLNTLGVTKDTSQFEEKARFLVTARDVNHLITHTFVLRSLGVSEVVNHVSLTSYTSAGTIYF